MERALSYVCKLDGNSALHNKGIKYNFYARVSSIIFLTVVNMKIRFDASSVQWVKPSLHFIDTMCIECTVYSAIIYTD